MYMYICQYTSKILYINTQKMNLIHITFKMTYSNQRPFNFSNYIILYWTFIDELDSMYYSENNTVGKHYYYWNFIINL